MHTSWNVKSHMRDGLSLSADIYLPETEGSYPTILMRTPYQKSDMSLGSNLETVRYFTQNGYAYMIQDVRGRGDSEGEWNPFFNEGKDGYDTIEWIATQPWCNGKVGMIGHSYMGWTQWAAAREKPPHLVTISNTASGGNFLRGLQYLKGIPVLNYLAWLFATGSRTNSFSVTAAVDWERAFRHLPLKTMNEAFGFKNTVWQEWMSHPTQDDYWSPIIFTREDYESLDLPVLHVTGYYDRAQTGALNFYEGMIKHSPAPGKQYLVLGPWNHMGTRWPTQKASDLDFTPSAVLDMNRIHLEWFDYWLKGKNNDVTGWSHVRYFMMGKNDWRHENKPWLNDKRVKFYLDSGGKANTVNGDGVLEKRTPEKDSTDSYMYNPDDPLVIVKDFDMYGGRTPTPYDMRFILDRSDVLVYTSAPLANELEIAGKPVVELYAGSDCLDTDWFALLMDVYPDGRSVSVGSVFRGLRARYRESLIDPELLVPGSVYRYLVELDSTAVCFLEGHCIRLAITSSAFPFYARNQNTGNPITEDTEIVIAENKVHHSSAYPSTLQLPIRH